MSESTTVVLLHGFAQTPRSWDDAVDFLVRRSGCAVEALDFSEQMSAQLGWDELCDELLERWTSFDQPPVVVGYSMGGRIALGVLCRWWRERCAARVRIAGGSHDVLPAPPFSALVLEGAGLGPSGFEDRASLLQRNGLWAERLNRQGVEAFVDYWEALPLFATQSELSAEKRLRIRGDRLSYEASELVFLLDEWGAHRMPDDAETCAALRELRDEGVAVLYVAGEMDAKYAAVAGRLEGEGLACASIVARAGHNVHEEQPDAFAETLAAFLETAFRQACPSSESPDRAPYINPM